METLEESQKLVYDYVLTCYGGVVSDSLLKIILKFALTAGLKSLCFTLQRLDLFSRFHTVTLGGQLNF